jgi:hypothetical protein
MSLFDSPLFPNLIYLSLMAGLWFAALAIVSPGTGALELLALVALAAVAEACCSSSHCSVNAQNCGSAHQRSY